jgi:hypothetical protein
MESVDSKSNPSIPVIRALPDLGKKAAIAIPRLRELKSHPSHDVRQAAEYASVMLEQAR